MLPDVREVKRRVAGRLARGVQEAGLRHAPLLAEIQSYHQVEGNRFSCETHDGDIQYQEFKPLRTPVNTKVLPSPIEQESEIVQKLDAAAQDIAKQHMQLLFTTISESSERVGTAYHAGGRPFDMGMFLDVIERMQVDFDDRGRPKLPTIVMHPDQLKAIGPKLAEWDKDRALQARWEQVLAKKKEEWRDREGRRKLVR
jgi:hypothetical protein